MEVAYKETPEDIKACPPTDLPELLGQLRKMSRSQMDEIMQMIKKKNSINPYGKEFTTLSPKKLSELSKKIERIKS